MRTILPCYHTRGDFQMNPLLKKRRAQALAAGVTVITVAGALIGATLKSKQQMSEREVLFSPCLLFAKSPCSFTDAENPRFVNESS
jgi:hypothetical protein